MTRSKSDYEELAATPGRQASLEHHRLMMEAVQLLRETMARDGISKASLAEKLGRTRGFVSQIFSGTGNLTLKTLGALSSALDLHIHLYGSKNPTWNVQYDASMLPNEWVSSPRIEAGSGLKVDLFNGSLSYKVDFSTSPVTYEQVKFWSASFESGSDVYQNMDLFLQTKPKSAGPPTVEEEAAA